MGRRGRIIQLWQSYTGRMIFGVLAIQILLTPLLFYGILHFVERGFQSQFIDQVRNNTYLYAAAMHPSVGEENIPKQMGITAQTRAKTHLHEILHVFQEILLKS